MKTFKVPSGTTASLLASKRSRRGRTAKSKGKAFERVISEAIAEWLGLTLADVVRTRSGTAEADIGLSAAAQKLFPFHVECKNQKALSVPAWIRQAEEAAKKLGGTPLIVFKQHGDSTPYAIIDFYSLMELATRHLAKGTENE